MPGSSTTTIDTPTTSSTDPTTGVDSSSGGPMLPSCLGFVNEAACKATEHCAWRSVVQYAYGAQGCQGTIVSACTDLDGTGEPSAWYRQVDESPQVLEFGYRPENLDPTWTECDCDGPLACLCASVSAPCEARREEFCAGILPNNACNQASIGGVLACATFSVSPEGPPDGSCTDQAAQDLCLPGINANLDTCSPPMYQFGTCGNHSQDLFWRVVDGIIEVMTTCGPEPIGWNRCEGDPPPDQPAECACRCL